MYGELEFFNTVPNMALRKRRKVESSEPAPKSSVELKSNGFQKPVLDHNMPLPMVNELENNMEYIDPSEEGDGIEIDLPVDEPPSIKVQGKADKVEHRANTNAASRQESDDRLLEQGTSYAEDEVKANGIGEKN